MAGEQVLVVDDDPDARRLLVALLAHGGYRVATAEDGEVALLQIEARRPDLILLDMVMPGMTGWAFMRRLAELGLDVPVVVISGRYAKAGPLGELSTGVAAYVSKPFNMAQLLETCARVIGSDQSRSERRASVRQPLQLGVTVRSAAGGAAAVGQTTNVSRDGMDIALALPLPEGQPVELALGLPRQPEPLRIKAVVRWSAEGGLGVAFVDLSAAQRSQIEMLLSGQV